MTPRFPARRSDGTAIVAARFRLADTAEPAHALAEISGWITANTQKFHLEPPDFISAPHVDISVANTVHVLFDIAPSSKMWKDWVVYSMRAMEVAIEGLQFEAFEDRVAGTSVRLQRTRDGDEPA